MLSWILASASTTPNAPADESQTMVTGRVCKNILGLFSNGIKETLEVKLKLVPVPTCMQSEYVENMERYHSLSKIMPEGMDYKEWAEFLRAHPAIGQLAQPTPRIAPSTNENMSSNTIESLNEMMMTNSSFNQHRMSFGAYDTRASSPAMSTTSMYPYQMNPDFRPASQASFHSEPAVHSPYHTPVNETDDQPEEGPPKKRAKVTKAKRPRKTALGPNADSLRVAASTAASVRLHRPTPVNVGAAVSAEQVPRAPTPRPHHAGLLTNCPRVSAPSRLRDTSADERRSHMSQYDSGIFSDNAIESADDDKGDSPSETPPNMPSSPPLLPEHATSPIPSSPELPMLPPPTDSGFASDMPLTHNDGRSRKSNKRERPALQRQETELKPIDPALLKHFLKQYGTDKAHGGISQSIEAAMVSHGMMPVGIPTSSKPSPNSENGPSPPSQATAPVSLVSQQRAARAETPKAVLPASKPARSLARSQTWAGEPMSDAAGTDDGNEKQPRSGAGAKRNKQTKVLIKERLENAITQGQLPTFCANCGQIETPAWRKAYTRVETGTPENIELSSKGTGIAAFEVLNPADNGGVPHYRVFKTDLAPEEKEMQANAQSFQGDDSIFTTLTLCNSCGLWLSKKNSMRPQDVWGRRAPMQPPRPRTLSTADKPKRIRKPKKSNLDSDIFTSDAVIPDSDAGFMDPQTEGEAVSSIEGTADSLIPPSRTRSESVQVPEPSKLDESAARAALERAFQSSPVGVRGRSKETAIDLEDDLTPRPTRRLLFPSPRKPGEMKSLAGGDAHNLHSSRSIPTGTAAIPMQSLNSVVEEEGDKENCPPPAVHEDDLAHLFNSPKATPTRGASFEDLLKTPTPGSRQRASLNPAGQVDLGPLTPSRASRTPRGSGRAALLAPETPFTRQLNDLLSDSIVHGSPSQHFDFSAFPTFNTPGRSSILQFGDLLQHDPLSSDLPIPSSSPPKNFDFSVFEDPNTSTIGLWSGASIFDMNDAIMSDAPMHEHGNDAQDNAAPKILTVNGISLDFSAMIEEVVGNSESEERDTASAVPQLFHQEGKDTSVEREMSAAPLVSRPDLIPRPVQQKDDQVTTAAMGSAALAKPLPSRPDLIPTGEKSSAPARSRCNQYTASRTRCLRCKEKKKGCDRQRPCGRCVRAGVGIEGCVVDDEVATSPAFSASAETPSFSSAYGQEQATNIPVDPALQPFALPPVAANVPAQASLGSIANPNAVPESGSAMKQEVVTPQAMDLAVETASNSGHTTTPAASTP